MKVKTVTNSICDFGRIVGIPGLKLNVVKREIDKVITKFMIAFGGLLLSMLELGWWVPRQRELKYLGLGLRWRGGGGGGDRLAEGDEEGEGDDGEAVEGETGSGGWSAGSDPEVAGKGLDRGCSGGVGSTRGGGGGIGSDGVGDIGVECELVVKYSSTVGIDITPPNHDGGNV
ncbi:hypothetical protein L2E82_16718 [Cichorium intybus]|uniref:Uncharacterized protein n=1 Tax=Cichorium intybus TaxID=13427 RepID=A0ACB9F5X6_CICIN|nr:hypothetical protein L2E82_16718 [Cichorium intybus]